MSDTLTAILIDALKQIASYGNDGICPYGCDTPYIATKALVDYGNIEYKANASRPAEEKS